MKLIIQSVNFNSTEKLEAYIEKKVKKIEKLFDSILTVDVYLKVIKPESATNKQTEIKVTAPNVDFFASKTCDSFEESVDLSLEAIEKQIIKHKEKKNKN